MFRQFLPDTNKIQQCATVLYSDSAAAKSTELNQAYAGLLAIIKVT
jgi:hypothetical protein